MKFIQSIAVILIILGSIVSLLSFEQLKAQVQKQNQKQHQDPEFDIQIQGKRVPDTATVYVRYISGKKLTLAPIHFRKGKAQYKLEVSEPTLVMLFLARDGGSFNEQNRKVPIEKLNFYADPKEKGARISFNGSFEAAKVVSGKLEKEYQQYDAYLKVYEDKLEVLKTKRSKLYQPGAKDEDKLRKINAAIAIEQAEEDSAKLAFAKTYTDSYFALLGLKEAAGYHIDAKKIEPIFKGLDDKLRSGPIGLEFGKQIALAHQLRIGQKAPDFLQYDTNGKTVRLSDFKGKYVLLDFWASWCGPCRAQNPQVVALYNQFKGKNFEIIGISLDNKTQEDKWLKAIEHDNLTWVHVSDLKGWQNAAAKAYGIMAIPQNYLIGPDGHIVGEDLEIRELSELLEKVL